jgi:hypothetical protein
VSRGSWFYWPFNLNARLLKFAWGVERDNLNVCRMVWGTLGWPVGVFIRLLKPLGLLGGAYLVLGLIYLLLGNAFGLVLLGVAVVLALLYRRNKKRRAEKPPVDEAQREKEAQESLDKFEEWAEKKIMWFRELPETHPFLSALVLSPFLIAWNVLRLFGVILEPIGVALIAPAFFWIGDLIDDFFFEIRFRKNYQQPGAFKQAYRAFHDRTCRQFKVVE